ncbi:division/cell wall cluster transcriptional repressor MraZ [Candidatus Collierbacteria bacterium RIFOXYD1_FULL_40_9]|uniref:Transcriptional regulator MraZ n=1 Tax=Candidatus Collierbacteria bacterium RIFOXYD1_FULL_40_9 TaxID=1817731 RepID=A0A1F5FVK2_9BACT|nr:MAG: division/cell wall cluster transcriptional repressor MraZ [Candidatus Collierbacteria bacterium RIFOXYD1_FULL_40_9]
MFIGHYYHSIEAKGRLAIPATFRQQLASGGVVTWGLDGCLFLFPSSYWQKLSEKLASLPMTNPQARNLTRLLVQSASDLNLDIQGRTLIPEHLRKIANLKKQVVVAGSLNRIEIWDRDNYHKHLDLIAKTVSSDPELINLSI